MKISSFDRTTIDVLRAAVDLALAKVGEQHGIRLNTGRITYRAHNCVIPVEAAVIAADGTVASREAEDFKANAAFFGLTPEHLGQTFTDGRGVRFRLVGLNLKARKKPFLIEDAKGTRFVAPESMVLRGFSITRPGYSH